MDPWILFGTRLGLYLSLGLLAGIPLYLCLVSREWGPIARRPIVLLSDRRERLVMPVAACERGGDGRDAPCRAGLAVDRADPG